MDESWRVPIGLVLPSRRRSPEQTRELGGGLEAEDFLDVFGGPPPTVLRRQFSGGDLMSTSSSSPPSSFGLHHSPSFYDEVFRQPPLTPLPRSTKAGRMLPDFTIPPAVQVNGQSESELSAADDGGLSAFMSKLRPIAVPARRGDWPSPSSAGGGGGGRSSAAPCTRPCFTHRRPAGCAAAARVFDACVRLFRHHSSPGTAADWRSCAAEEESLADGGDSPFSVTSSVYDIPMATIRPVMPHEAAALRGFAVAAVAEEEEAGRSYVIEVSADGEAVAAEWWAAALDDAIAWAKEKSRG